MKIRITFLAFASLLLLSTQAFAYRIISVPSGDLLAAGYTRLEVADAKVNDAGSADGWYACYRLDTVPLKNLEIGVSVSDPAHKSPSTSVNLQYQVIEATEKHPNLTLGAWDLGSNTSGDKAGRSAYVAAYQPITVKGLVGPVKLHLGYGDQKLNGFFGGILVPLDKTTQFTIDYCPKNSRLPGASSTEFAVGHNITPNWRVKASDLGGYLGVGLVYIDHLK